MELTQKQIELINKTRQEIESKRKFKNKRPTDIHYPDLELTDEQVQEIYSLTHSKIKTFKNFSEDLLQDVVTRIVQHSLYLFNPELKISLTTFICKCAVMFACKHYENYINEITPISLDTTLSHFDNEISLLDSVEQSQLTSNQKDYIELINSNIENYPILYKCYFENKNFADIGRELGLSRERIRQRHNDEIKALKVQVKKAGYNKNPLEMM